MFVRERDFMQGIGIRAARSVEYDEVARVWMDSWVSVGLEGASEKLLADLRVRVREEVWGLYVAGDAGRIAAMLALRLRRLSRPAVRRSCLSWPRCRQDAAAIHAQEPADEIWLSCANNEKAIGERSDAVLRTAMLWYEREGFVLEKEEPHADHGLMMRHYRWKKGSLG